MLVLFFATFSMSYTLADTHDTNASAETNEEEALPLNDPFAGDESLGQGGSSVSVVSGLDEDAKKLSLHNFKLIGIMTGEYESYVSLINSSASSLEYASLIICSASSC